VKMLSISSCAATVIGAPIIVAMGDASGAAAKVGIAGALLTFGVFTTGLMHLYTKPYVHKMWVTNLPKDSTKESWDAIQVKVERLGIFANRKTETFAVGDTKPYEGWHPLGTFQHKNYPMYLDRDHFPDADLYNYISGAEVEEEEEEEEEEEGEEHDADDKKRTT